MSSGTTIELVKQSPESHFSKGPFLRSYRASGKRHWTKPSILYRRRKSSSDSEEWEAKIVSFVNKNGHNWAQMEEAEETEDSNQRQSAMPPPAANDGNEQPKNGEALRPALEELHNGSIGKFNGDGAPPAPPHKHLFTNGTKINETLPSAIPSTVSQHIEARPGVGPEAPPVDRQPETATSNKKEAQPPRRNHHLLEPGAREKGTSFANIQVAHKQHHPEGPAAQQNPDNRRQWQPEQRYREVPPWEQERHRRSPYRPSHADAPPWAESHEYRPLHPQPQHHRRDQDDHTIPRPPPSRPYPQREAYPPSRPTPRPYPPKPQHAQPRHEPESWVQFYYTSHNQEAWTSNPVRRSEIKKPRPPTAETLWSGGVSSKRRNDYQPRQHTARHADLFPESRMPWHKFRSPKTDPDESILVTNGIVSHAFPDWMWAGVYYDAGLCRYHMCGTATALRHVMWDNDRSSVMEEQLARHAAKMDLHGRGYVDPSPKARRTRRVNGLLIPPLEQRLLPPERRPVWDEMGNAHNPGSQGAQIARGYSQGQYAGSVEPQREQWPPPRPSMQSTQPWDRPRRLPPPPPPDAFNNPRGPTHGITHKYPPMIDSQGFYQPQTPRPEPPQSNAYYHRENGRAYGEPQGRGKELVSGAENGWNGWNYPPRDPQNGWDRYPRDSQNGWTRPPSDSQDEPNGPLSNGTAHSNEGSWTHRQSDSSSTLVRWKEDIQGALVNGKLSRTGSQKNEEYEMQPIRNWEEVWHKAQDGGQNGVHRVGSRPGNMNAYSDDVESWG